MIERPTHVHDAAIDIAELLETEQASAMGAVVEHITLVVAVSFQSLPWLVPKDSRSWHRLEQLVNW